MTIRRLVVQQTCRFYQNSATNSAGLVTNRHGKHPPGGCRCCSADSMALTTNFESRHQEKAKRSHRFSTRKSFFPAAATHGSGLGLSCPSFLCLPLFPCFRDPRWIGNFASACNHVKMMRRIWLKSVTEHPQQSFVTVVEELLRLVHSIYRAWLVHRKSLVRSINSPRKHTFTLTLGISGQCLIPLPLDLRSSHACNRSDCLRPVNHQAADQNCHGSLWEP